MGAPTYQTDLSTFDLAEATTNWDESTDGNWDDGVPQTLSIETDYYIQGAGCMSSTMTKTGKCTLIANAGTNPALPTDGAIFIWQYWAAPNALDDVAGTSSAFPGQMVVAGNSRGAFRYFLSGGEDYPPNPYGGWKNVAVDPRVTADGTVGTPTAGNYQYAGLAASTTTGISKGNPFAADAARWGRGQYRVWGGDETNGYATFDGMALQNDQQSNRWGLFREQGGGYLWKGLITLGYGTIVNFSDADRQITLDDCPRVGANFTQIQIQNPNSWINWSNIIFNSIWDGNSPISTVNKGKLAVLEDANVNIDACQFIRWDTFAFNPNSTVTNTLFQRCGTITPRGADLTGCEVVASQVATDTAALFWTGTIDPNGLLDEMYFSKGLTGVNNCHAIAFGTDTGTNLTLNEITFANYNGSNNTDDAALKFLRTTGTVTVNLTGMSTPSYRSNGALIIFVSSVNITLTGLQNHTEIRVFYYGTTDEVPGTGAEDVTTGEHTFSLPSGEAVDIRIICLAYQNTSIENYSATTNQIVPVFQVIDRQYLNP